MKISFDDIENAYLFISMGDMSDNSAILNRETGEIYYISELGDSDELPDDVDDPDKYIDIPDKYAFDLGKRLVFQFVEGNIPEELARVEKYFRQRGAYSKYKSLLEQKGLLDQWHKFEDDKRKKALIEWCKDNGIEISG